jgi:hypothetical protein
VSVYEHCATDPSYEGLAFTWPKQDATNVDIIAVRQKRAWRFALRNSDYVVEVSAMQSFVFDKPTTKYRAEEKRSYDLRWGLQVWHPCWDQWLGENAILGIGESAKWKPEEAFFFPSHALNGDDTCDLFIPNSGFASLVEVLETVERVAVEGGRILSTPQVSHDPKYDAPVLSPIPKSSKPQKKKKKHRKKSKK